MKMDDLVWNGADLAPKDSKAEGSELGALTAALARELELVHTDDGVVNIENDTQRALEGLIRAYKSAAPVFKFAELPLVRRVQVAGDYAELLARVTQAEIAFVGALARARSDWLFRAAHDGN
jgi:hypothetical protein